MAGCSGDERLNKNGGNETIKRFFRGFYSSRGLGFFLPTDYVPWVNIFM